MDGDIRVLSQMDPIPVSPPPPLTLNDDDLDRFDLVDKIDRSLVLSTNQADQSSVDKLRLTKSLDSDFTLPQIAPRYLATERGHIKHGRGFLKPKSKLRSSMASSLRTNTPDDQKPESVPFQPQNFMSSTRLKRVHISKRHLDNFGGSEYSIPSKRGIILHSDRYSWEGARPVDGLMSQRDRLRLEIDYIEKLRGLKKRREVWPHRAQMDLLMAGQSIEFEERFDLNGELQHLKSLVMPEVAKDLFHGKGIRLPGNHASVKPRPSRAYLSRLDDSVDFLKLDPKFAIDPDIRIGWPTMGNQGNSRSRVLPGINKHPNLRIGRKPSQPPGPILPQSKPSPLPRLELHPSHSYSAADAQQPAWPGNTQHTAREESSQKQSTFITSNQPQEFNMDPESDHLQVELPSSGDIPEEPPSIAPKRTETPQVDAQPIEPHLPEEDREDGLEGEVDIGVGIGTHTDHPEDTADQSRQLVNPLQGTNVEGLIPPEERTELTNTFQRLTAQQQGPVEFDQLQSHLPMSTHQELFLRQVYDIASSQSVFGVDEFMTMNLLAKAVDELSGRAAEAFTAMDLTALEEPIVKFVGLFESVDRGRNGLITVSSLRDILSAVLETDLNEQWSEVLQHIGKSEEDKLSKVEFLSLVPFFQSLSSSL